MAALKGRKPPFKGGMHTFFFPNFRFLVFFENFGPEMGSRRAGRGLKRFLEAVGFILAKFEPKRSHGDPIRDQNYGFGTFDMC